MQIDVVDIIIIIVYFAVVIGLGIWYQKKASQDINSYFLGGKSLHWLMLAMSGSVSTFDITGTMWIVSLLFILGMKSMWIHWMWGFMMGAFFLSFMGIWVRRSNVMTAAEWMKTRFGEDRAGITARTAYAFMAIFTQASFIGYAFQGIGKFASVYIPFSPTILSITIIGITTVYVVLGGLYSVVITDVIQTVILTIAGFLIMYISFQVLSPETIKTMLPTDWFSITPVWHLEGGMEASAQLYEWFGLLAIVWVVKGVLLNLGGPAQMYDFQRFLAARNDRDAAKVGAAWSLFLIVRWGMAMAIVLLALSGTLNTDDPEKVMPIVLQEFLPTGMRGLVIAGLLAAFMSTFSSTVNSAASYVVKDLWQAFVKPHATEKQLVISSYWSTIMVVTIGILIGTQAESIAQIWNWMMMALGAGVIIPNVLRWYWWRLNGWGYAAGTIAGILLSLLVLFIPEIPMYISFPAIAAGSLITSVIVSLLSAPVSNEILVRFYKNIKPFGWWKPIKQHIHDEVKEGKKTLTLKSAVVNTIFGIIVITNLYLLPMYWVGREWTSTVVCAGLATAGGFAMYITWYRPLIKKT